MNRLNLCITFIVLISLLGISCKKHPQEPDPLRRKSPIAIAKINHGDTYIKIVYGQPYKKGRTVFGDLVPYGEVWRTGANEATELTTTKDILLDDTLVKKGTYTLFTIPREHSWTILLNSVLGQWGAFDYNPEKDVYQFNVPSNTIPKPAEALTIQFDEADSAPKDSTSIIIRWDRTEVRIPVRFSPSKEVSP